VKYNWTDFDNSLKMFIYFNAGCSFNDILESVHEFEVQEMPTHLKGGMYRALDGRLTAMKKQGHIYFKNGWQPTTLEEYEARL